MSEDGGGDNSDNSPFGIKLPKLPKVNINIDPQRPLANLQNEASAATNNFNRETSNFTNQVNADVSRTSNQINQFRSNVADYVSGETTRKATEQNKKDLAAAEAAKNQVLVNEQNRKQIQDVQASQTIASLRSTAQQYQNNSMGSSGSNFISKDFLGL